MKNKYNIQVRLLTGIEEMNEACSATIGKQGKPSLIKMLESQHSPIREIEFVINCDIPSYVAMHLRTHSATGQRHYILSKRTDRGGNGKEDRNTIVHHRMRLNAQHLIDMSRKRLCHKAEKQTVKIWNLICEEAMQLMPELALVLMPECEFRGGTCFELQSCGKFPKK